MWADYSAKTGCAITGRLRDVPAGDADVPTHGQHEDRRAELAPQSIPAWALRAWPPCRAARHAGLRNPQSPNTGTASSQPENSASWQPFTNVRDLPEWTPEGSVQLGAHILSSARPFGKYFSTLTPGPANTYRYVYTLLHTYAHTVMKAVAEFSGLDVGSLGEYLFPADLAFVVYRNGTTMDLGNLSALWRNFNTTFLQHLLEPRTLMCGSGSLCDANGGACPSCIVIPETACVAGNWLLSRSVMRGGYAPREDEDMKGQRIPGFLDVATARWAENNAVGPVNATDSGRDRT